MRPSCAQRGSLWVRRPTVSSCRRLSWYVWQIAPVCCGQPSRHTRCSARQCRHLGCILYHRQADGILQQHLGAMCQMCCKRDLWASAPDRNTALPSTISAACAAA